MTSSQTCIIAQSLFTVSSSWSPALASQNLWTCVWCSSSSGTACSGWFNLNVHRLRDFFKTSFPCSVFPAKKFGSKSSFQEKRRSWRWRGLRREQTSFLTCSEFLSSMNTIANYLSLCSRICLRIFSCFLCLHRFGFERKQSCRRLVIAATTLLRSGNR